MSDEQARAREIYDILRRRRHELRKQHAMAEPSMQATLQIQLDDIDQQIAALYAALDPHSVELVDQLSPGQRTEMLRMQGVISQKSLSEQISQQFRTTEDRLTDRLTQQAAEFRRQVDMLTRQIEETNKQVEKLALHTEATDKRMDSNRWQTTYLLFFVILLIVALYVFILAQRIHV